MSHEQQLALAALEAYITAIKQLRELQQLSDAPYVVGPILFALYDLPKEF
jgi:hypothetical protein